MRQSKARIRLRSLFRPFPHCLPYHSSSDRTSSVGKMHFPLTVRALPMVAPQLHTRATTDPLHGPPALPTGGYAPHSMLFPIPGNKGGLLHRRRPLAQSRAHLRTRKIRLLRCFLFRLLSGHFLSKMFLSRKIRETNRRIQLAFFPSQGIMLRSSSPTSSIGCCLLCRRRDFIVGRPA